MYTHWMQAFSVVPSCIFTPCMVYFVQLCSKIEAWSSWLTLSAPNLRDTSWSAFIYNVYLVHIVCLGKESEESTSKVPMSR